MNKVKKVLKVLGVALGVLLVIAGIAWLIFNEKEPEGTNIAEADIMAQQMLEAVNKPAWDALRYVQWSFRETNHYLWDKKRDVVQVKWEDKEVILFTKTQTGMAKEGGQMVKKERNQELLEEAWTKFANDSFWFNAPVKIFDEGTKRSIVTLDDGRKGLKVEYTTGGVTPGDSYVWLLDDNYMPTAWKMWVKVIPVGGVETTWEDWQTLPGGAKVAASHKGAGMTLHIGNIKGGNVLADFGLENDPFVLDPQ